MFGLFSRERIVAGPGYNRWKVPPASVAIHLCIGSVYAWSMFNQPLTRVKGVVISAAGDWSLAEVVWVFTVAIVFLGVSAAFSRPLASRAGAWHNERVPEEPMAGAMNGVIFPEARARAHREETT
jgi:hypothetical protein